MTHKPFQTSEREIAKRLASTPRETPPPELLDRLRAEIPDDLGSANDGGDGDELINPSVGTGGTHSWWSDRRLHLAATLLLLAGAGILTWELRDRRAEFLAPQGQAVQDMPTLVSEGGAARPAADTLGEKEAQLQRLDSPQLSPDSDRAARQSTEIAEARRARQKKIMLGRDDTARRLEALQDQLATPGAESASPEPALSEPKRAAAEGNLQAAASSKPAETTVASRGLQDGERARENEQAPVEELAVRLPSTQSSEALRAIGGDYRGGDKLKKEDVAAANPLVVQRDVRIAQLKKQQEVLERRLREADSGRTASAVAETAATPATAPAQGTTATEAPLRVPPRTREPVTPPEPAPLGPAIARAFSRARDATSSTDATATAPRAAPVGVTAGEIVASPKPAPLEPPSGTNARHLPPASPADDVTRRAPLVGADRSFTTGQGLTAFDAMFFDRLRPNPFVETAQDSESTFGLDVDTGSYTVGRRYLQEGRLPPPESVRVEEYLNAFDYGDAPPHSRTFAIDTEGAQQPRGGIPTNRRWLRIGIAAREIAASERQPAALTFLVDTSGSMQRENRLGLVKKALVELLDELRDGDTVALVTYGTNARVVLAPTADREAVRQALSQLYPEGSTNLADGMRLAYEMAARNAKQGVIDRIILCSDGVANVGLTDPQGLLRSIADWAAKGIELTTVGFGMGNYNDALMEQLADHGDGHYAYVDRLEEARKIFVENLTGTLQTVAADARIQVTFDPETVARYRLVGYENRDLPDQAFRDPRTDAGEIGAGHKVTALYELELSDDAQERQEVGEVRLRYRSRATGGFEEMGVKVRVGDLQRPLEEAAPSLRLALLVGRFAEALRLGEDGTPAFDPLLIEAQRLVPEFPGRTDVLELANLIGRARDLQR